jgi:PAS domain S-box-containing protein
MSAAAARRIPYAAHTAPPAAMFVRWSEMLDVLAASLGAALVRIVRRDGDGVGEITLCRGAQARLFPPGARMRHETSIRHYWESAARAHDVLAIDDAGEKPRWRAGAEFVLGLPAYLGAPIRWPDGTIFGVLDALHAEARAWTVLQKKLLGQFRDHIEADLAHLDAGEQYARALRAERDRLALAAAASGAGVWDYDIDADKLYCDARWYAILGIDPAKPITSIDAFKPHIHPEDVARATEVKATFAELMAKGEDYHIMFRVIRTDGEVRWVKSAACLIEAGPDSPNRAVGAVIDLTEQVTTQAALTESEQLFKTLADTVPQIIFSAKADGTTDYLNKRWREFTGVEGLIEDSSWPAFLHPEDRDRVIAAWREAVHTGQPYDAEYRYRHHSGEYRWLRAEAAPLRDGAGRIMRWFGVNTDIHAIKLLETERELVARELDHRVKNLFALMAALVSLSVRDDPAMAPYADRLRQRLSALVRAHNLIWQDGRARSMRLQSLLRTLLEPYETHAAPRITVSGADIEIDAGAITPLALIFHELATNAAKYGALQTPAGTLRVCVTSDGDRARIDWVERAAAAPPAAVPPDVVHEGFGSKLFGLIVEKQLRGSFSRRLTARGAAVRILAPLATLGARVEQE